MTTAVCGRRCLLGWCTVAGRVVGGSRTAPTGCMLGLSDGCASVSDALCRTAGAPLVFGEHIVGAVREPPTTPAVRRCEGVADNVHGGLSVMVGCDVVGVSACDDDVGLRMASIIGLVRRGGTGRGRFTNRPYGLYGRSERPVRACVGCDVPNGRRTPGIRRTRS